MCDNKRLKKLAVRLATGIVSFGMVACSYIRPESTVAPDKEPVIEVTRPGVLKKYDFFYVAPIETLTVEGDYLRRVEDREVATLAERFRFLLMRQLGDRYTTFPQPAKNVAILKVSLTDVTTNYAALQLRPGVIIPNAMRGGASIEAEFLDSMSKERLVLVNDSKQGERQGFLSGFGKWDGVTRAFEEWAQMLGGALRS